MSITQPNSCATCPLYGKSRGFAVGVGDPRAAKMAFILETPASNEIGWFLNNPAPDVIPSPATELLRRQELYPNVDRQFLIKGVPVVGATGNILNGWIFPKVGIRRSDVYISNTLSCLPQRNRQNQNYPTGTDKTKAEHACRQYDAIQLFRPDAIVITFHPAALMREITPLPLLIRDLEKANAFVKQGLRTLVLMGGRAAEVFLGYGSNVSRWRGHYELTAKYGGPEKWYERVLARVEARASRKGTKRKSKSAQLAAGAGGVVDVLDITAPKKRWKPGCKVCGIEKSLHPTTDCATYVSGRNKKEKLLVAVSCAQDTTPQYLPS
jgi:uracil-DNA glycosylase